jgi:hypothetical protein
VAKEGIAERVFGVLFTRWWAGLLLGAALSAAGAFIFWGLAENPGQGVELKRSARQMVAAGALAFCGLCLMAVGVINLFGRGEPPSPEDS